MMYFSSRTQAGRMLANQLAPRYRYEDCAVIALNDGGVVVGAQIAMQLHCSLNLLITEEIVLPREGEPIATIAQDGSFSYNRDLTQGQIDEMVSEYFTLIEQEKMQKMQLIHQRVGQGGTIRADLLKGRNIILVSDALPSGHVLDVAIQYLKPLVTEKLIVATPLAGVGAVDYMHVLADELACLSVVTNFMDTDHYYDKDDVPRHEKIIEIIEKIILYWK